jgi:hypothetical protein
MNQRADLREFPRAPRLDERRVFPRGALDAPFRAQMGLHIALRQRMQPREDFRRDRLHAGHDEGQMKFPVETAGRGELAS